jgi:Fanconi anemia group M protein
MMNAAHDVHILVDDREQAGGLPEALRRRLGARVEVMRLVVGDVMVGEDYVIERKEAADFVASLLDGRLANQAQALGDTGRTGIVLIEGEFSRETLAGMAAEEVRAAILSLQLDRRLTVIRSRNREDSAYWIEALARRAMAGEQRPFAPTLRPTGVQRPHPTAHRARPRPPSPGIQGAGASDTFLTAPASTAPMVVLLRIPGFGKTKAKGLLAHFGTLQRMIEASEAELAAAPGMGPIRALRLREALNKLR